MIARDMIIQFMTDLEIAQALVEESRPHRGLIRIRYYGDRALGETAAIAFMRFNADTDSVAESNFRVARRILSEEFPDSVSVESFGGVMGKGEWLIVEMLTPNGELTPAGARVVELYRQLADYPILDDDDHQQLLDDDPYLALKWYGEEAFREIYGDAVYKELMGIVDEDVEEVV